MSNGPAAASFDDTALDLIGAFVESNDANLRGNALQALAVLASANESGLAGRAEELLVRALAAGPASVDPEWQRRLRVRALDALRELGPEQREKLLKKLMLANRRASDKAQQAAVSTLLLEALSCDLFRPKNWFQLKRLMTWMGAPKFWIVVWAATWRYAVVLLALALVAAVMPQEFGMDVGMTATRFSDLYIVVIAVPLIILVLISFIGRPKLPLLYRLAETLLSGILFAVICIGGAAVMLVPLSRSGIPMIRQAAHELTEFTPLTLLGLAVLGFAVGASIRSIRWFSKAKFLAGNHLRPLWALLIATAACMAAARIGMGASISAAAWIAIAPVAVVVAALDDWLEQRGPDLSTSKEMPSWPWITLLVAAVLFVLLGGYLNAARAWPEKISYDRNKVKLPDDSGRNVIEVEDAGPVFLSLTVDQEDRYVIHASPSPPTDIALMIISNDERYNKRIDNDGPEETEEHVDRLRKGNYIVCAASASPNVDCQSRMYKVDSADLLDLGSRLIAGTSLSGPDYKVRIRFFRPDDRPQELAPNTREPSSKARPMPPPPPPAK
jgi:hypothetical protein